MGSLRKRGVLIELCLKCWRYWVVGRMPRQSSQVDLCKEVRERELKKKPKETLLQLQSVPLFSNGSWERERETSNWQYPIEDLLLSWVDWHWPGLYWEALLDLRSLNSWPMKPGKKKKTLTESDVNLKCGDL